MSYLDGPVQYKKQTALGFGPPAAASFDLPPAASLVTFAFTGGSSASRDKRFLVSPSSLRVGNAVCPWRPRRPSATNGVRFRAGAGERVQLDEKLGLNRCLGYSTLMSYLLVRLSTVTVVSPVGSGKSALKRRNGNPITRGLRSCHHVFLYSFLLAESSLSFGESRRRHNSLSGNKIWKNSKTRTRTKRKGGPTGT